MLAINVRGGKSVGEVVRLSQTCGTGIPDRWTLWLRRPEAAELPAPGTALELMWPGSGALPLTLLLSDFHTTSNRVRLVGTRLKTTPLGRSVRGCLQGLLLNILGEFNDCLTISDAARRAVQSVSVHLCCRPEWQSARGGETIGQLLRRMVRLLAAERGVPLRLKAGDGGKLLLTDPRHDVAEDTRRAGSVVLGHGDPLAPRPAKCRIRESWSESEADGFRHWTALAETTASAERGLVTAFSARWWAAGEGRHAEAVRFRRRWMEVPDWLARERRRVRPSGWATLARMGAAAQIEGQQGAFFEVEPLAWFPSEGKSLPQGKLIARLASPYAGDSEEACGLHLVPVGGALVWVESPSVFTRPVILGEVRTRAIRQQAFGVYLPRGKNWHHRSATLHVRATSKFGPAE